MYGLLVGYRYGLNVWFIGMGYRYGLWIMGYRYFTQQTLIITTPHFPPFWAYAIRPYGGHYHIDN